MGALRGMRQWAQARHRAIVAEREDNTAAQHKIKKNKPKGGSAKHVYKGRPVDPGSRAQVQSDSVKNRVRHAFNADGSRLRFRQRWIAVPGGSEHRTRKGALKRCENGEQPYVDRFTR